MHMYIALLSNMHAASCCTMYICYLLVNTGDGQHVLCRSPDLALH